VRTAQRAAAPLTPSPTPSLGLSLGRGEGEGIARFSIASTHSTENSKEPNTFPKRSTMRGTSRRARRFGRAAHDVSAEACLCPRPALVMGLQVIERGETDRIWRMIYELQSGEPG
jgi:hypothetical protein